MPVSLVGGVLALAVVFWLALAAAALVPSDLIAGNLAEAHDVLGGEGEYPVSYVTGMAYDNFTVGVMVDLADGMDGGSPFAAALVPGYARYWHGYLVFLRPLLAVCGIYRIRFLCQVAFAVLTAAASVLLCKRLKHLGAAAACVLVLSEALVGAFDAVSCLPLFPSFALSLGGVIWVLAPSRADARDDRMTRAGFFFIGALTVYFDFLDNPVITMGMPAAVLVLRCFCDGRALARTAALAASCAALWLAGYGLLWAAKWVIASVVLGADVIGDAMSTAQFRVGVGERAAELDTSPLYAVRLNVETLGWPKYLLAAALVGLCAMAVYALASRKPGLRAAVGWIALLAVVAAVPYAWYVVLSNHSVIHATSIAFRTQVLTLFALGLALTAGASALRPPSDARA